MTNGSSSAGKILRRANPSTIQDKFLVGYQGWFTCAGDGEPVGPGHHGWLHWFNFPIPDGGRPNTDVWPDVSSYSPSELFPAPGLKLKTGEQAFLFSSRNPKTVQRHFHWMAEHGVDGAFLQRFAGQCDIENGNEGVRKIRDEVGERAREAAEREGRVFAIMYDVSGVPADRIQRILERDWTHLVRNQGVLDSPNYLREGGKPVIALWGFGFHNSGHTPALVHSIIQFFRNTTPGGAYIMGGAPSCWRLSEGDAERDPEFVNTWLNEFNAISPWTIGRYKTEQEADHFAETKMKGDLELIKRRNEESGRKVDYIPVVLPGGSGCNLSEGKWGFNDIKRLGGRFLWKQIFNAKHLGVRTMYGAMWDEYDEGTAFMPIVEHKRNLPQSDKFRFLALDEDGYDVPSDWYMRICGFAAEGLRSERRIHETFPVKELQDYYSSRPKYEEVSSKSTEFISGSNVESAGGSGSHAGGDGQTYQEWLATQKESKDEPPPPPYTLIAEEDAESTPSRPSQSQTSPASQPQLDQSASIVPSVTAVAPPTLPGGGNPADGTSNHPIGSIVSPSTSTESHSLTTSQHTSTTTHSQQQQPAEQGHDAIGALVNDFGKSGIGGPQTATGPSDGRIPGTSAPPPVHPAHPAAGNPGAYGRQSFSRPTSRPQSQQGHPPVPPSQTNASAHSVGLATSQETSPVQYQGTWSNAQWPPPEWGANNHANAAAESARPTGYPQLQSGYGRPSSSGGANLSRPQTFTASSNSQGGANLRPSATVSGGSSPAAHSRPSSRPSTGVGHATHAPPPVHGGYPQSAVSDYPPAGFPGSNPHAHSPPPGRFGDFPYPQARPPSSSYNHASGTSSYSTSTSTPGFPSVPPASSYSPVTSYPGQTSAYPGQQGASGSSYSSDYNWSGGPPVPNAHISPPHSPPAHSTFPGTSPSYPYSSAQPYNSAAPYFPQAGGPPTSPPLDTVDFPQGPGGGFYGGNGFSMPSSSIPSPPGHASPYPGQQGGAGSTPGFPGQPGSGYSQSPAPGHWTPSSGPPMGPSSSSSLPPPFPPRPPTHSSSYGSTSNSATNFPIVGGAMNYALSAVDKVAGKKTKEQLESSIGSIAQSSTKLYNKFLK